MKYEFSSELRLWPGHQNLHFVTLPPEIYEEIREVSASLRRGFGAVRVDVQVGKTQWRTSVFPMVGDKVYMMLIKMSVRKQESLGVGSVATFQIELVDF